MEEEELGPVDQGKYSNRQAELNLGNDKIYHRLGCQTNQSSRKTRGAISKSRKVRNIGYKAYRILGSLHYGIEKQPEVVENSRSYQEK